jgi:hypothetical protein
MEIIKLRQSPFWEVAPQWASVIAAGGAFTSGALSGYLAREVPGTLRYAYGISRGDLPEVYHAALAAANYIIFSYQTPIAWRVPRGTDHGGWWLPDVTYSLTTTQHQELIQAVLRELPEVKAVSRSPRTHTFRSYAHISLMKGCGHSPYGPRRGW